MVKSGGRIQVKVGSLGLGGINEGQYLCKKRHSPTKSHADGNCWIFWNTNKNELPDLIHLFVANEKQFLAEMKQLKTVYRNNSSVITWVSWYMKSADLVDVNACAVSEQWSGLKLVVPKAKR